MTVDAVAHVTAQLYCDPAVGSIAWGPLVPPGARLPFDIQLQAADGAWLGGTILHAIDETQLLVIHPMSYAWQSCVACRRLAHRATGMVDRHGRVHCRA